MNKFFNIVIFQMGDFYNKASLFNNCIESVKNEFPNDNIIIFHSLEEIEEKYYIPHNEFFDKFIKQQETLQNMQALSDYVRVCLTNYIDDMLYIDVDITIFSGFRNYILSKINAHPDREVIRFQSGTALFYCRKKNKKINDFIKYYTNCCLNQNHYLIDASFQSYLDNIGFPYYEPNYDGGHNQLIAHNVLYSYLLQPYTQIFSDFRFVVIDEWLHCIPVMVDSRFQNFGPKVNIVDDEIFESKVALPHLNFLTSCLDISNEWAIVKKSFYLKNVLNDYFLKNNTKLDAVILANLYENNSLNDIHIFYDQIKQKEQLQNKNYKIFILKQYKKEEILYPLPKEINIVNATDWNIDIFRKMTDNIISIDDIKKI